MTKNEKQVKIAALIEEPGLRGLREIDPKPKDFQQWIGSKMLTRLLAVICAFALIFVIAWAVTIPKSAEVQLLAGCTGTDGKCIDAGKLLEVYSKLRTDHLDQFKSVFQIVVSSTLVPLFTLLAGYVFGKGEAASSAKEGATDPKKDHGETTPE
jgi:phosphate/sulfate permease